MRIAWISPRSIIDRRHSRSTGVLRVHLPAKSLAVVLLCVKDRAAVDVGPDGIRVRTSVRQISYPCSNAAMNSLNYPAKLCPHYSVH